MILSYINENGHFKRIKYAKEIYVSRPVLSGDLLILKEKGPAGSKDRGFDLALNSELYEQLPLTKEGNEAKLVLDVLDYIRKDRKFRKYDRILNLRRYL